MHIMRETERSPSSVLVQFSGMEKEQTSWRACAKKEALQSKQCYAMGSQYYYISVAAIYICITVHTSIEKTIEKLWMWDISSDRIKFFETIFCSRAVKTLWSKKTCRDSVWLSEIAATNVTFFNFICVQDYNRSRLAEWQLARRR